MGGPVPSCASSIHSPKMFSYIRIIILAVWIPGNDEIPDELLKVGGNGLKRRIMQLVEEIWKQKKPDPWKQSLIISTHKKGDRLQCANYRGISHLPTTYTYKILTDILLKRLEPYAEELVGEFNLA